jgi:tetratricopeptide (TPR) repeat protein
VGQASRKKKTSISDDQSARANREKKLAPLRESPSRVSPQNTPSIIKNVPIFILLLISFLVYLNALFGAFVFDDRMQVVQNPWIRSVKNIPTIFSKNVWSFQSEYIVSNYYRPLMHLVYMFNYYLFGMNPWGFHLVNILFHCGVTVLVFQLIRRFLTEQGVTKSSVYFSPAFIAAVLFAVHPIHTEAVTWIAGLPDVAFTFFYLFSFYLYVRSKTVLSGSYLLSVVCFAIAALFKEPALTLPAVLLAYDFVYGEKRPPLMDCMKRYIPYLVIATAYLALRIHVLGGFAPRKSHVTLSTYEYVINVFPLFSKYLEKLLVPLNLNALYVFHPITSLLQLKGILSLTVTAIFVVLIAITLKKSRVAFLGLLLIMVPLLPVLDIPALGKNTFTDRYLYLPSVGYVLLIAIFLAWTREKLPRAVSGITIVFMVIGGLYTVGTITRNNVWKDTFSLWSDTVKKSPDSSMAHGYMGAAYQLQGQLDYAIAEYQTSLRLDPYQVFVYNNLGLIYRSLGQLDKAIAEYQTAILLMPDDYKAHRNLGVAYESQGQLDKAIAEYQTALRLRPDDYKARQLLNGLISRR